MRTRDWRRNRQEVIFVKRLKMLSRQTWYKFRTCNGEIIDFPDWYDFIGTQTVFSLKNGRCNYWRYKPKYSPNKDVGYHRDKKKLGQSCGLREKDKIDFLKILKEHGLR